MDRRFPRCCSPHGVPPPPPPSPHGAPHPLHCDPRGLTAAPSPLGKSFHSCSATLRVRSQRGVALTFTPLALSEEDILDADTLTFQNRGPDSRSMLPRSGPPYVLCYAHTFQAIDLNTIHALMYHMCSKLNESSGYSDLKWKRNRFRSLLFNRTSLV